MENKIVVNGETYVKEQKSTNGRVIVRCRNAGVHVGTLDTRDETNTVLLNANRIFRWRGAHDLSNVATEGVNRSEFTRISIEISSITLTTSDTCEIIPVSDGVDLSAVYND